MVRSLLIRNLVVENADHGLSAEGPRLLQAFLHGVGAGKP